jgi:predicted nucleotidyltransferase
LSIKNSKLPLLDLDEIRAQILPILREFRVAKAIVFGSVSRGPWSRKNDIDLIERS